MAFQLDVNQFTLLTEYEEPPVYPPVPSNFFSKVEDDDQEVETGGTAEDCELELPVRLCRKLEQQKSIR
jgi:hypothetical protein